MTLPQTPPGFVHSSTVLLEYPYVSPTLSLTLPSPEFNNSERISVTRVLTESRGGDLLLYRDGDWPTDDELAWTITNLTRTKKEDLEEFIQESLGKAIKLTDHEGLVWRAIITNPEAEFVQDYEGDCDRFTVSLTFNVEWIS